jgi:predicted nicotinamide N-methyase
MGSVPSDGLFSRYLRISPVRGCKTLNAYQSDDIVAFWDEWEKECGCECGVPFWAAVWPGAAVCAQYLLDNPEIVAGQTVLDLGCGGGIAGIAAALCGAKKVIANDIDTVALQIALRNARANETVIYPEERDLICAGLRIPADVILVADMFYERGPALQTMDFLSSAADTGARVLVADGQRTFAPRGWGEVVTVQMVPVDRELEGVDEREVRLIAFSNSTVESPAHC